MTTQDGEIYNNSQICWIWKEDLNKNNVIDHCHIMVNLKGLHIIKAI